MPEFILDCATTESHEWLASLHPFTQGAVEALCFLAPPIYIDSGDGDCEPVEWLDAGAHNLTADARTYMEAESVRFYLAHRADILAACEHGGRGGDYDETQAGRDWWFSSTGTGTGFQDRGLPDDLATGLADACQYQNESAIDAAPAPGADLDALAQGDTSECVLDSMCAPSPLTEAERAALGAVWGAADVPALDSVSSRYGAPLGRVGARLDGLRVAVGPVRLDAGGYDSGGAYWGTGVPLWRAFALDAGKDAFARAPSYAEACAVFRSEHPGLVILDAPKPAPGARWPAPFDSLPQTQGGPRWHLVAEHLGGRFLVDSGTDAGHLESSVPGWQRDIPGARFFLVDRPDGGLIHGDGESLVALVAPGAKARADLGRGKGGAA